MEIQTEYSVTDLLQYARSIMLPVLPTHWRESRGIHVESATYKGSTWEQWGSFPKEVVFVPSYLCRCFNCKRYVASNGMQIWRAFVNTIMNLWI